MTRREKLYDDLVNSGIVNRNKLGEKAEFLKNTDSKEKLENLKGYLSESGVDDSQLGDDFVDYFGADIQQEQAKHLPATNKQVKHNNVRNTTPSQLSKPARSNIFNESDLIKDKPENNTASIYESSGQLPTFSRPNERTANAVSESTIPQSQKPAIKPIPQDLVNRLKKVGIDAITKGFDTYAEQKKQEFLDSDSVKQAASQATSQEELDKIISQKFEKELKPVLEDAYTIDQIGKTPNFVGNAQMLSEKINSELAKPEYEKEIVAGAARPGLAGGINYTNQFKDSNNSLSGRMLESAKILTEDAQTLIDADKSNNKSFVSNVGKGVKDYITDLDTWMMNKDDLSSNADLLLTIKKQEKGEQLSEQEQILLDAAANKTLAEMYTKLPAGYKAGKMFGEQIPFMVQLAAGSGIIKGVTSGVKNGLLRYIAGKVESKAAKTGVKAILGLTKALAVSGATLPFQTSTITEGAQKRQIGAILPGQDMKFSERKKTDSSTSPMSALAKETLSMGIENFTEQTGAFFAPGMNKIGARVFDTKFGHKYQQALKAMSFPELEKMYKAGFWNGLPSEWLEEQQATILHAMTGDAKLSDLLDKQQQADILIGLATTQGVFSMTNTTANVTQKAAAAITKKRYKDEYLKAREKAVSLFSENEINQLDQSSFENGLYTMQSSNPAYTEVANDYVFKKLRFDTMIQTAAKKADAAAVEAKNDVLQDANQDTGIITQAKINDEPVFVIAGDASQKDGLITVRHEDGTFEQLTSEAISDITMFNPNQAADEAAAVAKDQVLQSESDDITFSPDNIVEPGTVVNVNGVPMTIIDTDGETVLLGDDKGEITATYDQVRQFIQDDLDAAQNEPQDQQSENNQEDIQTEPELIEANSNLNPASPEVGESIILPQEQQDPQLNDKTVQNSDTETLNNSDSTVQNPEKLQENANENEQTQSLPYPTDKNGNIDYTSIQDPDQYASALLTEFPENSIDIVNELIQDNEKAIKNAAKKDEKTAANQKTAIERARMKAAMPNQKAALAEKEKLTQVKNSLMLRLHRQQEEQRKADEERKALLDAKQQEIDAEKAAKDLEQGITDATSAPVDVINPDNAPDFSVDKSSDARERGYRMSSGYRIDRQKPIDIPKGRQTKAVFSTNDSDNVDVNFSVINADDAQPSHTGKQRNPKYFISEAQPKERTDNASDVEADKIASSINPELITASAEAYSGTPITNNRGEVIQGNNRTTALRKMYDSYPEQAQLYKQYLIDNAAQFGLDPEQIASMDRPMLIRVADVNDDEAIRLGQKTTLDLESGGKQRIDPKSTLEKLGDRSKNFTTILFAGDPDSSLSDIVKSNAGTAMKYLYKHDAINNTQFQSAFRSNGILTPEATDDLINITASMLLRGGNDRLDTMFASLPDKAKRAILQTIYRDNGYIIDDIRNSIEVYYMLSQQEDFINASKREDAVRAAKSWYYLNQLDFNSGESFLPANNYDIFALELAILFRSETLTSLRNRFNEFYDKVKGEGGNMFEQAEQLPVNEAVKKIFNVEKNGSKQDSDNEFRLVPGDGAGNGEQGEQGRNRIDSDQGQGEQGNEQTDNSGDDSTGEGEISTESTGQTGLIPEQSSSDIIEQIKDAENNVDLNPTEAQKEAGNYKKGHVIIQGLDLSIEQPAGSIRSGVDENGKPWSTKMKNSYGYFRRSTGRDGDHIDVFLGPNPESQTIFVVDQNNSNKEFDESKVMLGFNTEQEAYDAYMSNYEQDWQGFNAITPVLVDEFKTWLYDGARQYKAYSEYKGSKSKLDFPKDKVVSAYSHLHMNPYNTAKVEEDAWKKSAEELKSTIQKYIPELTEQELTPIIDKFKQDYLNARESVWKAASISYSPAVAGGSNFNSRQANQRGNALDRKQEEFLVWLKKEVSNIENTTGVTNAKSIEREKANNKKAEAKRLQKNAIVKHWMNLKVGDRLDIGNPSGNPVITKKNKFSVESGSGAKWTLKEVYGIDHSEAQQIMDEIEPRVKPEVNSEPKIENPNSLYVKSLDETREKLRRAKLNPSDPDYLYMSSEDVLEALQELNNNQSSPKRETLQDNKNEMIPINNSDTIDNEDNKEIVNAQLLSKKENNDNLQVDKKENINQGGSFIQDHKNYRNKLYSGQLSIDELKESYNDFIQNKDATIQELNKLTKPQLLQMFGGYGAYHYKNENKDRIVRALWHDMLKDFYLSDTITVTWGDSSENVIKRSIDGYTQKDLDEYYERVKKAREDREAEKAKQEKALTNPEALEEYRLFISKKGYDALSTDQRAAYDLLETDKVKQQREAVKETLKPTPVVTVSGDMFTQGQFNNTKTGETMFVVSMAQRVSNEEYKSINSIAKKNGGYYSSFNKGGAIPGFLFKSQEAANSFMSEVNPEQDQQTEDIQETNETPQQEDEKTNPMAVKLREAGLKVIEAAENELNKDRLTNTPKRAREAGYAEDKAREQKRMGDTMVNIADAIQRGDVKLLDGIKTKTHDELLDSLLKTARYKEMQAKNLSYTDRQTLESQPITAETVEYLKDGLYPRIYADSLNSMFKNTSQIKGVKLLTSKWQRVISSLDSKDYYQIKNEKDLNEVITLFNSQSDYQKDYTRIGDIIANYKRLRAMGIDNDSMLRAALREYAEYRGKKQEANKATELERAIVGRNVGFDFFPTPEATANRMVKIADIEQGMTVLEPSAGNGNIADAIKRTGIIPDVVELSSDLTAILEAKGYPVIGRDFMELENVSYDRIVMNPPFSNGVDGEHVKHAYDLLKPGGRIVAIVGEGTFIRSDKKATAFREWLEEIGASDEKLDNGTFNDRKLLNTTGANARIVVIDKPDNDNSDDDKRSLFSKRNTNNNSNNLNKNSIFTVNGNSLFESISQGQFGEENKGTLRTTEITSERTSGSEEAFRNAQEVKQSQPLFLNKSPLGFYSTIEKALDGISQEKGTPEQFKAMLLKNGAKQAEIDWLGWDDFISGKKSITKTDIQNWIEQNEIQVEEVQKDEGNSWGVYEISSGSLVKAFNSKQDARDYANNSSKYEIRSNDSDRGIGNIPTTTKYHSYVLPEGENYKEVLLTMPTDLKSYSLVDVKTNKTIDTSDDYEALIDKRNKLGGELVVIENDKSKGKTFKSVHFDEPNILAHIRFDEHNANGEKVLFIEEIQSDWAQDGKKKGFGYKIYTKEIIAPTEEQIAKDDYDYTGIIKDKDGNIIKTFKDFNKLKVEKLIDDAFNYYIGNIIPNMPFKNTDQWVNLALRRMMVYAVQNGFNRIAWTTGEQQAERYNLSKHIDNIVVYKNRTYNEFQNATYNLDIVYKSGGGYANPNTSAGELSDLVGKELADKIIKDSENDANTGAVKHKYSDLDLKVGGEGMKAFYNRIIPAQVGKLVKPFGIKVKNIEMPEIGTQQSIELNDELTSIVLQGVPLFNSSTGDDSKLDFNYCKDIIQKIDEAFGFSTILVNNGQDLIKLLPYIREEVENSNISGVYNNGNVYLKVEGHDSIDDLLLSYIHEHTHKAAEQLFSPRRIIEIAKTTPNVDDIVDPEFYKNLDDWEKGQEILAHTVVDLIKKNGYDNFINNKIDLSLLPDILANRVENIIKYYENSRLQSENRRRTSESKDANQANGDIQRGTGTGTIPDGQGSIQGSQEEIYRDVPAGSERVLWRQGGQVEDNSDNTTGEAQPDETDTKISPVEARLRKMINSRDEKIKALRKDISGVRKEFRLNKDVKQRAKIITDFAKRNVNDKIFDAMQKIEYNAIITEINNAIKANDIDLPFTRLVNIINTVELKGLQEQLDNILNIKVVRKDKKNVSIANKVDDEARSMLEKVRYELSNLKMPVADEQLQEMRTKRKQLLDDYKAFPGMQGIKEQIKDIQKLIDKRKTELKHNKVTQYGSIKKNVADRIENLENEPELSEDQVLELKALHLTNIIADVMHLDGELMQNEIDKEEAEKALRGKERDKKLLEIESHRTSLLAQSFDAHTRAIEEVYNVIEEGINNLNEWVQKKYDRKRRIGRMFIEAVKKNPIPLSGMDENVNAIDKISAFFKIPLWSFDFAIKHIDKNHPVGKGELFNHFMRSNEGILAASDNYLSNLHNDLVKVNEICKNIFGKNLKSIAKESSKVHDNILYIETEDGHAYPVSLSKGQAMYIYMVWKMDDGRAHLMRQGIKEEDIEFISDFIGDKYIAFSEAIQNELLPELRKERYNPTHIQMFGTSMGTRENYFPLVIDRKSIHEDISLGQSNYGLPRTITGNIINRTNNLLPIDIKENAFHVLEKHLQAMEQWNAYSQVVEDLNKALSNLYVKNLMEANEKGSYQFFKDATTIAVRQFESDLDSRKHSSKMFGRLQRNLAVGNIAFKIMPALKQLLSLPAFLDYSTNPLFIGMIFKNMSMVDTKYGTIFNWAIKNLPSYRERVTNGYFGNEVLRYEKGTSRLGIAVDKIGDIGMTLNRGIDALSSAVGAKAVYDYALIKYKNISNKEELARYDAEAIFNETQQSNEPHYLSIMQADGGIFNRAITTYMNNNIGYYRKLIEGVDELFKDARKEIYILTKQYKSEGREDPEKEALRTVMKSKSQAIKRVVMFGFGMQAIWYYFSTGVLGFGGDDDDKKKALMKALSTGPTSGMPLVGNATEAIFDIIHPNDTRNRMDFSPLLFVKEWNDNVNRAITASRQFGLSPELAKKIIGMGMKFGGINAETFENIAIGAVMLANHGQPLNDDKLAALFILNVPASQRKIVADELFKGKSLEEYSELMAIANKAFKADKTTFMIYDRPRNDKLYNSFIDEWYDLNNKTFDDIQSRINNYKTRSGEFENDSTGLAEYISNNEGFAKLTKDADYKEAYNAISRLRKKIRDKDPLSDEYAEQIKSYQEKIIDLYNIYGNE